MLDDIFGNPTDLPIAEHTTDTAGQTLATFAIFNLAGLQFSPRIRDIGRLQLYRLGPGPSWRIRYPHAAALLTQPIQTQLIADHYNDLLRLVGSMKFGYTTASLLIAKLHASSRQNSLARALQEYGRLVRTIYLCLLWNVPSVECSSVAVHRIHVRLESEHVRMDGTGPDAVCSDSTEPTDMSLTRNSAESPAAAEQGREPARAAP